VNENKDTIGKIDDLIISHDDHKVYAVVSVGGFLGMGSNSLPSTMTTCSRPRTTTASSSPARPRKA
jgi:hypothetical protein